MDDALEERPVDEQIAELLTQPREPGPRAGEARAAAQGLVQRRMALEARDERRGVGAESRRRRAEDALERAARPGVERPDRGTIEPEWLEEPRGELGEAELGHDHLHARRGEAPRILERDAGEPVQRDRRLAAARAAEDEQRAIRRCRDRLELVGVEQRGDVRRRDTPARASSGAEGAGARRGARAAAQRGTLDGQPAPDAVGAARHGERPGGHARQHAVLHDHDASRLHHARRDAARERLLELLALAVAVEDRRHRRVPPVHDSHARPAVHERMSAEAVVADLARLPHPQVREVGGARIGEGVGPLPLEHGADEPHLLEHGRQILRGRLERLVAELAQAPDEIAVAAGRGAGAECRVDGREERLLLRDDCPRRGVEDLDPGLEARDDRLYALRSQGRPV